MNNVDGEIVLNQTFSFEEAMLEIQRDFDEENDKYGIGSDTVPDKFLVEIELTEVEDDIVGSGFMRSGPGGFQPEFSVGFMLNSYTEGVGGFEYGVGAGEDGFVQFSDLVFNGTIMTELTEEGTYWYQDVFETPFANDEELAEYIQNVAEINDLDPSAISEEQASQWFREDITDSAIDNYGRKGSKQAQDWDEDEESFEPDEDDVFIQPSGTLGSMYGVSFGGEWLGEFSDWDDVEEAIREKGRVDGWYPNVWDVSDHGNMNLVEVNWSY